MEHTSKSHFMGDMGDTVGNAVAGQSCTYQPLERLSGGGGRVRSPNHCFLRRCLLSVLFSEAFLVTDLGTK